MTLCSLEHGGTCTNWLRSCNWPGSFALLYAADNTISIPLLASGKVILLDRALTMKHDLNTLQIFSYAFQKGSVGLFGPLVTSFSPAYFV